MKYAESIIPGDVIGLKGDLGTGKTQFVKGICSYFKVNEIVNSPTFIIVNEYKGFKEKDEEILIHHFDLYRLKSIEELETIGFGEYLSNDSICLIEWCELAAKYTDIKIKIVNFEFGNDKNDRIIKY